HRESLKRACPRAGDGLVTTLLRLLGALRGRVRRGRSMGRPGGLSSGRTCLRELEPKRAAAPGRAFDAYPPTVKLDRVLHDREAEPRSTLGPRSSAIDPVEAFEEPRHVLGLDPAAGVLDRDPHPPHLASHRDANGPRISVLDRVLDEVVERDLDPLAVHSRFDIGACVVLELYAAP